MVRKAAVAVTIALLTSPAFAQEIGAADRGAWEVIETKSELDGVTRYTVSLSAARGTRATLGFLCGKGPPTLIFLWPQYVTNRSEMTIRYKIDEQPIQSRNTIVVSLGRATSVPLGAATTMANEIVGGGKLVVQAGAQEAIFDLKGAGATLSPVLDACGLR